MIKEGDGPRDPSPSFILDASLECYLTDQFGVGLGVNEQVMSFPNDNDMYEMKNPMKGFSRLSMNLGVRFRF